MATHFSHEQENPNGFRYEFSRVIFQTKGERTKAVVRSISLEIGLLIMFSETFQYGKIAFCHAMEAQVCGVNSIHGTILPAVKLAFGWKQIKSFDAFFL